MSWTSILSELNQRILDNLEALAPTVLAERVDGSEEDKRRYARLSDAVSDALQGKRTWFGFDGVHEAEIVAKELELGVSLPQSYREFLMASNGFLIPGRFVGVLLPLSELDFFGNTNPWICDMWLRVSGAPDFVPERRLASLLQVSAKAPTNSDFFLVEPSDPPPEVPATAHVYDRMGTTSFPTFEELFVNQTGTLYT